MMKRRLALTNPCATIAHFPEKPVNRYPSTNTIATLLGAADDLADEGRISLFFAAGLRVLATTGARRSEIFAAQWDWAQYLERADLVLPDSKTGPKRIALPGAAIRTIAALPRLSGSPYIFPSMKRGVPFVNFNAAWSLVLYRANVGRWRIHDLRHGFASAAVSNGASLFTVGSVLGHPAQHHTAVRDNHLTDIRHRRFVRFRKCPRSHSIATRFGRTCFLHTRSVQTRSFRNSPDF